MGPSALSGNSHLFPYGEIAFSDLPNEDYVQTVCFAYNFHAKRFVRWAGRYNKRARARTKGEATGKAQVRAMRGPGREAEASTSSQLSRAGRALRGCAGRQ